MTERVTKQQLLDIKTDMKLLLECMNYQKDNPSALKQALVTLSSSLQSCNEAKDIFRDTGGLQSVLATVTTTKYCEVTEAGLYCLGSAVEKNVYSQKLLSTASTFTFLHSILSDEGSSLRKKRTAAFLILCLVSNNGFGQNLARESACLHDVISLIRTSLPGSTRESSAYWLDRQDGKSVALWCALVSTACVCVNNPLNEENQRICASLLPFLFSLLQHETNHKISRPILSLVGLTVANNAQNQDRVRKCGGLDIFVKLLRKLVSKLDTDVDSKTTAVHLLNTLDSCIADNEENARLVGKLGAIRLMLKLLSERSLEDQNKTQIVLTLAHSADMYDENKNYIKDSGGITSLIQQLTLTENEELSKTVKYLLQMCVSSDKEVAVDFDENNNLADVEPLIANMEKMKRQNDLQMLEKINELDEKLRSMEKEAHQRQESITQLQLGTSDLPVHSPGDNMEKTRSEKSFPLSRREVCSEKETPVTPREKSLLSQLDKEKKEKERLETLNQMLQENMHVCLTHVAAKENCSKYESCQKRSRAQTGLGAHTGSEAQSGSGAQTGLESHTRSGGQTGLGSQTRPGVQTESGADTQFGAQTELGAHKRSGAQTLLGSEAQAELGAQTRPGAQTESGADTRLGAQTGLDAHNSSGAEIGLGLQTRSGAWVRLGPQTGLGIQTRSGVQEDLRPQTGLGAQTGIPTPGGDACHHRVVCREMESAAVGNVVSKPVDLSVKRNIFNTNSGEKEPVNAYCDGCVQYVTHENTFHQNVQSQKVGNTNFRDTNFSNSISYDQNNHQNLMSSQSIHSQAHNSEKFSAVPLQTQHCSQNALPLQAQSVSGITQFPDLGNSKSNLHTQTVNSSGLNLEIQNKPNSTDHMNHSKNNNLGGEKDSITHSKFVTRNIDRVLQIQNTQPYVMLERISAATCGEIQTTSQNKQLICEKSSESVIGSNTSIENTPDLSKCTNTDNKDEEVCMDSEVNKAKAKRVLLEYRKAVSKSTLTTPSLSKIATSDKAELNSSTHLNIPTLQPNKRGSGNVKQTANKITETQTMQQQGTDRDIIESMKSNQSKVMIQPETSEKSNPANAKAKAKQTEDNTTETEKRQQESANCDISKSMKTCQSKILSNPENSETCTPDKANAKPKVAPEDISELFVKPNAPPPRRKIRVTPQLGSGKLPTFPRKRKEATSQAYDTDNSDIDSEFDFELLKTAKQNTLQQFLDSNGSSSVISRKSIPHTNTCSKRCLNKLNSLTVSSQIRCSDWSAIQVTPTKRQTVLPRPAFSDCGSRRPVFDSPVSVKSAGRIRMRALDDSGIYSPENGLNVSPGASTLTGMSGSSVSQSDLSSYFNDYAGDEYSHSKGRERNKKKQITVYKKQDKCPGCQAPAKINGQTLNSRTYNIALETDPNTCLFHRKLRQYERLHIHQVKRAQKSTGGRLLDSLNSKIKRREKRKKAKTSVYEFESDITEQVSPASQSSDDEGDTNHYPSKHRQRRQRLEYTEDEEENLLEGVRKRGRSWTQILATYQFHPSRTAVDLKDKYKSMMRSAESKSTRSSYSGRSRTFKPFSMCEERRLRRGIKKFGYSWKSILEQFTFSRDRTAEDLRNRWRSMHRRGTTKA